MNRRTDKIEDDMLSKTLFENLMDGQDYTFLLDFIGNSFNPEDIFSTNDLEKWAEENGFIKES